MIIMNINDLANNYDIKPECATERVDDNLWNIIFTRSSLKEIKWVIQRAMKGKAQLRDVRRQ